MDTDISRGIGDQTLSLAPPSIGVSAMVFPFLLRPEGPQTGFEGSGTWDALGLCPAGR